MELIFIRLRENDSEEEDELPSETDEELEELDGPKELNELKEYEELEDPPGLLSSSWKRLGKRAQVPAFLLDKEGVSSDPGSIDQPLGITHTTPPRKNIVLKNLKTDTLNTSKGIFDNS